MLLAGFPAAAYRLEFSATYNEKRLAGSEVCFFRAESAQNPFSRYLATDDVRCLPSEMVIDLPPGKWNYYVQHPDGYISVYAGLVSYEGPTHSEVGYKEIAIPMQPAGRLDLSDCLRLLQDGERIAVYFPNPQSDFRTAVHPLPRG